MFKIFRIHLYYLRLIRGMSISFTLIKYFWVNWMSSRRFALRFIPKKYKRDGIVFSRQERLRILIEDLGPTFIKFGQILADRPDIISDQLREELKKLQSTAKKMDDVDAIELIEEELGAPLPKIFLDFQRESIGSASIGQVYKGILKDGQKVIVKIQRPNIKTKIKTDLSLLRYFADQLVKEYPGLVVVDVVGFVDEFGETLLSELDYTVEASNAMRFAEIFRDVPYCNIPRIHADLCTRKLLVMDLVEGITPDEIDRLVAEGYDLKEIAKNGTHVMLTMIFKHGFFHADPHPGNIFIQPGNTIALIDFGMVGVLKPKDMQFLAGFTLGMATRNAGVVTDALLTLCDKKFFRDKEDLAFSVNEMMLRYGGQSYEKTNFSQLLNECIKIILKYELQIPASIYLLLKALATIEKFGYNLDPDISLPEIIKPYAKELIQKNYAPRKLAGNIFDIAKDYMSLIRDFPGEVGEILFKLKEGKLIHDIRMKDPNFIAKPLREIGRLLTIAVIIGFMFGGSVALRIWGQDSWISDVMLVVSSIFAFWIVLRLFFKIRL